MSRRRLLLIRYGFVLLTLLALITAWDQSRELDALRVSMERDPVVRGDSVARLNSALERLMQEQALTVLLFVITIATFVRGAGVGPE